MRIFFVFLFTVLFSLNSAYAAAASVCDVLEHAQSHAVYFDHHSGEHPNDCDAPPADSDGTDKVPVVGDHHHVHPGFSILLPGSVGVIPPNGSSPLISAVTNTFVSAPQVRLDRPPRAALS